MSPRSGSRPPFLETLEDRTLFAGHTIAGATALDFLASGVARVPGSLTTTTGVDLYKVQLAAGDTVAIAVDAQDLGSPLDAALRLFNSFGATLASNEDLHGRDPGLTFQAAVADTYYLGVSRSGNLDYDPDLNEPGLASTAGFYTLTLRRTSASLLPDLVGGFFQLDRGAAAAGDTLTIQYAVENRGGAEAGPFTVEMDFSGDNHFDPSDTPLASFTISGLSADTRLTGQLSVTLPANIDVPTDATPQDPRADYIGMRLDTTNAVTESNKANNTNQHRGMDWQPLTLLYSDGIPPLTHADPNSAAKLNPDGEEPGNLSAGGADFYRLDPGQSGALTTRLHAAGFHPRISLLGPKGELLAQADGGPGDALLTQHLDLLRDTNGNSIDTSYFLEIQATDGGSGSYTLTDTFQPGSRPYSPITVDANYKTLASGDLNGDGVPDLVVEENDGADIQILLGRGDGTFAQGPRVSVGSSVEQVLVGDFNGDGIPDLAVAPNREDGNNDLTGDRMWVLLGKGDGTFLAPSPVMTAPNVSVLLAAGDFQVRGQLDLIAYNTLDHSLCLLRNNGDGTFTAPVVIATGLFDAHDAVVGDFTSDGLPDLALNDDSAVVLLPNLGDGTFGGPVVLTSLENPGSLVAADFRGNGDLDLAVGDTNSLDVRVLLGDGAGHFQEPVDSSNRPVRPGPVVDPNDFLYEGSHTLITGDFNGDGILDLAVSQPTFHSIAILPGLGNGLFGAPRQFAADGDAQTLIAADFSGDGNLDLATLGTNQAGVGILPGNGDLTFQGPKRLAVEASPIAIATGDFNRDGTPDLAVVNYNSNDLSIQLAAGDGTFQTQVRHALPSQRFNSLSDSVVAADFNGDGRLDLAVDAGGNLTLFLGVGDGRFQQFSTQVVGTGDDNLLVGDFDGDGKTDLVLVGRSVNHFSFLRGRGDGSFSPEVVYDGFDFTFTAAVAADFNNDKRPDLALLGSGNDGPAIRIWYNQGDGTFPSQPQETPLAPGGNYRFLTAADFNNDGREDLAVTSTQYDTAGNATQTVVDILLGRPNQSFGPPIASAVTTNPGPLVPVDLNGDGVLDLATADPGLGAAVLLMGAGDGSFRSPQGYAVGLDPVALATGDFNRSGHTGVAVVNQDSGDVTALLGKGGGKLAPSGTVVNDIRSTPQLADWDATGTPGVAVLDQTGRIFYRPPLPGQPGAYGAAELVNDPSRNAARDIAYLYTPGGLLLAALDAAGSGLSFHVRTGKPNGFARTAGPIVPDGLPVRLLAADLNGDGRDDLIVAGAGTNQVFIYLQSPQGTFGQSPDYSIPVGANPSDLAVADVDGDGRLDLLVTDQQSGDLSVLRQRADGSFIESRFHAGTGLHGVASLDQVTFQGATREGPAAVTAGLFAKKTGPALVVANSGADALALLRPDGDGGFLNPESTPAYQTGERPIAVAVGSFDSSGRPGVVVLNAGTGDVSVFLGDGTGNLEPVRDANGKVMRTPAGEMPTGLTVRDVNGDGKLDLIVGNAFGDVLVLLGDGAGHFRPFQLRRTGLDVTHTRDNKQDLVVVANETKNDVVGQSGSGQQLFKQDASTTNALVNPSSATLADVTGDGIPDLIVANTGSNNVLVYPGLSGGGFGQPVSFFAGSNPVRVTARDVQGKLIDLNGDGMPDLVVTNEGSNDDSILLSLRLPDGSWTLVQGPRLATGGTGPVATLVGDFNGDGVPDLLVTNSQSNNVALIPGVGNGFFNDQALQPINVGGLPQQALVGHFVGPSSETDLLTVNAGSGDLTLVRNFEQTNPSVQELNVGGVSPVAAFEGSFAGSGFLDLVIADQGDNALTLLDGGPNGLTPMGRISAPPGGRLSDVAPSVVDATVGYLAEDNSDEAFPFKITDFAPSQPPNGGVIPPPSNPGGPEPGPASNPTGNENGNPTPPSEGQPLQIGTPIIPEPGAARFVDLPLPEAVLASAESGQQTTDVNALLASVLPFLLVGGDAGGEAGSETTPGRVEGALASRISGGDEALRANRPDVLGEADPHAAEKAVPWSAWRNGIAPALDSLGSEDSGFGPAMRQVGNVLTTSLHLAPEVVQALLPGFLGASGSAGPARGQPIPLAPDVVQPPSLPETPGSNGPEMELQAAVRPGPVQPAALVSAFFLAAGLLSAPVPAYLRDGTIDSGRRSARVRS